mmetsp:Transcript_102185/g.243684  ORF Transcript_102185/g.243684 Transcript_102185/m.243684 type:complete len:374 (-) Transcript_102185:13-1134(-)
MEHGQELLPHAGRVGGRILRSIYRAVAHPRVAVEHGHGDHSRQLQHTAQQLVALRASLAQDLHSGADDAAILRHIHLAMGPRCRLLQRQVDRGLGTQSLLHRMTPSRAKTAARMVRRSSVHHRHLLALPRAGHGHRDRRALRKVAAARPARVARQPREALGDAEPLGVLEHLFDSVEPECLQLVAGHGKETTCLKCSDQLLGLFHANLAMLGPVLPPDPVPRSCNLWKALQHRIRRPSTRRHPGGRLGRRSSPSWQRPRFGGSLLGEVEPEPARQPIPAGANHCHRRGVRKLLGRHHRRHRRLEAAPRPARGAGRARALGGQTIRHARGELIGRVLRHDAVHTIRRHCWHCMGGRRWMNHIPGRDCHGQWPPV